ncbi:uncharacterized protein STEHIDRAFT_109319 [Stereum hirsutum FP-91666 SS1]|uniref:uncharacterized protein n=1 Tax=Stereum hirsutum (strain FP-91666) TaxID=721885 RepID=UPI00044104CE|nr:uncharacterized protein STEHIDRAFT_109319 [Stereum hirsutum FP-91666 SS1]EIM89034.1 hypothetical protein STEHIDRAFT_109319 [Stereum hirsutum FP-91666 SS1]
MRPTPPSSLSSLSDDDSEDTNDSSLSSTDSSVTDWSSILRTSWCGSGSSSSSSAFSFSISSFSDLQVPALESIGSDSDDSDNWEDSEDWEDDDWWITANGGSEADDEDNDMAYGDIPSPGLARAVHRTVEGMYEHRYEAPRTNHNPHTPPGLDYRHHLYLDAKHPPHNIIPSTPKLGLKRSYSSDVRIEEGKYLRAANLEWHCYTYSGPHLSGSPLDSMELLYQGDRVASEFSALISYPAFLEETPQH